MAAASSRSSISAKVKPALASFAATLPSFEDVARALAVSQDVTLRDRSCGPLLRVEALAAATDAAGVERPLAPWWRRWRRRRQERQKLIGSINGLALVPPLSLGGRRRAHVESLRVERDATASRHPFRRQQPRPRSVPADMGRLLLLAFMCRARQLGCAECWLLAIDDAPQQHRRLVRYFERLGGTVVRRIGDAPFGVGDGDGGDNEDVSERGQDDGHGLARVRDRLVWGGRGALMRLDVDVFIARWGQALLASVRAAAQAGRQ